MSSLLHLKYLDCRGKSPCTFKTDNGCIQNLINDSYIIIFCCIPVEEKISLLIGAATQRFTDDVTVSEWRRASVEAHR